MRGGLVVSGGGQAGAWEPGGSVLTSAPRRPGPRGDNWLFCLSSEEQSVAVTDRAPPLGAEGELEARMARSGPRSQTQRAAPRGPGWGSAPQPPHPAPRARSRWPHQAPAPRRTLVTQERIRHKPCPQGDGVREHCIHLGQPRERDS